MNCGTHYPETAVYLVFYRDLKVTATPSKQPGRLSNTVYVLAREVMCPVFHHFAPPFEYVASCVGLLGC